MNYQECRAEIEVFGSHQPPHPGPPLGGLTFGVLGAPRGILVFIPPKSFIDGCLEKCSTAVAITISTVDSSMKLFWVVLDLEFRLS